MGRKSKNAIDELDQLLLESQKIRAEKDRPIVSLPSVPISKRVMEFAQTHGSIKYREMRELLSAMTKCRKLESEFCQIATPKLSFKPDNWSLFFMRGQSETNTVGLIPETIEAGQGLVPRVAEIQLLYRQDAEVRRSYDEFEVCWRTMDRLSYPMSEWIREQFKNGSLEAKITAFKNKTVAKKTRISKALISNFVDPSQAEVVKGDGELPALSVGEREAMQFLLWKIENMTETELHIRDTWILDGKEERPKENGYAVVFERTEALKKNYGDNIEFSGWQFKSLEDSLTSLLKKERKLVLVKGNERAKITGTLIRNFQLEIDSIDNPGLSKHYAYVQIPYDVAHLHDKLYTSFPSNHIALIRNTPPGTRITDSEICFFDILWQEAPHDRSKTKTVRRKKDSIVVHVGGKESREAWHQGRIAGRIEALFAPKAINMGILKRFEMCTNADGEEIYEWEYSNEEILNRLLNKGKAQKDVDSEQHKRS